jgi:hypothetical protein
MFVSHLFYRPFRAGLGWGVPGVKTPGLVLAPLRGIGCGADLVIMPATRGENTRQMQKESENDLFSRPSGRVAGWWRTGG